MKRDNRLDVVRCFANYIIILLHAGAAFQYCLPESFEFKFWTFLTWVLCTCALPAMFMISGYLLFKNYDLSRYGNKLSRRVKRLAIPYFAWNTFFVLFYVVCAHFVPRLSARVASFELDSLGGAINKIASLTAAPIDGPLWFLRTLFILSLVSPLLWLFLRSRNGRVAGALMIIGLYAIAYYTELLPDLSMTYPLYALVVFCIGGSLAITNNAGGVFEWFKSKWWFIPSMLGIALISYKWVLNISDPTNCEALIADMGKLFVTPLLFMIVSSFNVNRLAENKAYQYMKDMSFFAYAGHFLFCSMIMHTAAPFLGFMTTGKFTVLVLIFCGVGVPVMAGIYWIGRKYLPHIMKLYDGTL